MDRRRVTGWKKLLPGTGWAFRRVSRVWGLAPVPRATAPLGRRAAAVRRVVALAAPPPGGASEPVGVFPEGEGDGLAGLRSATPAAGSLLALLGRRGVPLLPVGVWLEGDPGEPGRLTARIGGPWLHTAGGAAGAEEVMLRIGALLPPRMWGAYRDGITRRVGSG